MVDSAATEHGALPLCLSVAVDLEQVDLGVVTDPNEREPSLVAHRLCAGHLGTEDFCVEGDEPLGVRSKDRDVVKAVEEHRHLPLRQVVVYICRQRNRWKITAARVFEMKSMTLLPTPIRGPRSQASRTKPKCLTPDTRD